MHNVKEKKNYSRESSDDLEIGKQNKTRPLVSINTANITSHSTPSPP